jgi:anaerobic selenocysteine-containing dehydrogenase
VKVRSLGGQAVVPAHLRNDLAPGVVIVPYGCRDDLEPVMGGRDAVSVSVERS